MAVPVEAESAVRRYLTSLTDPDSLLDCDEIARRQEQVEAATDPIERLLALSRLERSLSVDVQSYAQEFVDHAHSWAQHNGVSASAFRQMGVPDEVLRLAGFDLNPQDVASTRSQHDRSSRSVTIAALHSQILERLDEFTHRDVMTAMGGSPMTIRKAVDGLIEEGLVDRLGPAPGWSGRGRAPIVYRVVRRQAAAG